MITIMTWLRLRAACRGLFAIGLPLMLGACDQGWVDSPSTIESEAASVDHEWPSYGGTGAEQRYAPLDQIHLGNIQQLSLAWYFDLPPGNSMTAPVMADGSVFITTGHSHVRALNAVTGELIWEYDSRAREMSGYRLRYGYGSKGLAYWNGRVFIATHDGRVIALDSDTGEERWTAQTLDITELPHYSAEVDSGGGTEGIQDHRYVNGPPRVFDGKVIIGHGGADVAPARGYVDCFDAMTGERLWRFYTVPGDPAKGFENDALAAAAETWSGEWWKWGGGGTVWNAISYDSELNHFYLGVGNGYPYNHALRSEGQGDNLYLASIVAVDADTGEYVWHYQTTPAEHTDYNASMDMTLATLSIDGQDRQVLIQAPKNGFLYVIDRTNGELISAEPYAKVSWATHVDLDTGRPVEVPGYRYHGKEMFELWPSVSGAHSWQPQSFNPDTGLLYLPVIERASLVGDQGLDLADANVGNGLGGIFNLDLPGARKSYLKAWDPVAQQERWTVETPGDWPGGTMTTAGNLVFQGQVDGRFTAYNASSGEVVWSYQVGVPVLAPPISYSINGRQYVVVLSGSGTTGGGLLTEGLAGFRTDYRLPRRVLAFAIDGNAELPADPPQPLLATPVEAQEELDEALAERGELQYMLSGCLVCHGNNAVAGGAAPDLRMSPYLVNPELFLAVVQGGALVSNGMPQFKELTRDQVESIREFLRARSRALARESGHNDSADKAEEAQNMTASSTHERGKEVEMDIDAREAQILGAPPRIQPLKAEEFSPEAKHMVDEIRAAVGAPHTDEMPEYFATMLRHPGLMQQQIALASQLHQGELSIRHRELAILRVAWLNQAPYEWSEHVQAGKRLAGLTSEEINRVTYGSSDPGWSGPDRAILRAVEEMHADAMISDETWAALEETLNEKQLLELPVLVGAYQGTAYLQNSVRFRLMGDGHGLKMR